MTVVGIDFGVRRLAMVASPGRWTTDHDWQAEEFILGKKEYPPGEHHDPEALDRMYCETEVWVKWWKPELVVIERPIQGMSANVSTGLRLAQVAGVLAVACRHAGSSTLTVSPSEWKKAVIGVGNANKDTVSSWLNTNQPEVASFCDSQDLVDAACMALYAQAVLGG